MENKLTQATTKEKAIKAYVELYKQDLSPPSFPLGNSVAKNHELLTLTPAPSKFKWNQ